ncbi:MAG TPA: hypothetical protein VIM56_09670 [Rhizomicrobium sp.]
MIGDTLGEFIRSFGRAPLAWVALLIVATGTNVVDLVYGATGAYGFSQLQIISLAIRLIGVFWILAVALRGMMDSPESPWALDRGIAFFLLWQLVILVLQNALSFTFVRLGPQVAPRLEAEAGRYLFSLIVSAIGIPLIDLLSLRFAPWIVARTARISDVTFGKAWKETRGLWGPACGAYFVLVLPLSVVHFALTAWITSANMLPAEKINFAVVDGVESSALAIMLIALYTALYGRSQA